MTNEDQTTGDIEFDHLAAAGLPDPFPLANELRERCPVARSSTYDGFWLISRYKDIVRVARDTDTFSSRSVTIPDEPFPAPPPPVMVDPPVHNDFRHPLLESFSPRAIARLEPGIRNFIGGLIDDLIEDGHADLAPNLLIPFPAFASTHLLDLPAEDTPRFCDWSIRIFENDGDPSAVLEMAQYFGPLYDQLAGSTRDDIPSLARRLQIQGREITVVEFVLLMTALMTASLDTTTNATAGILIVLSERPDLRQRLIDDPALLPIALEEMLRYVSPLLGLSRVVTQDTEVGSCPIKAGDRVLLSWMAGNHDPEEFPNPEEIVLDRTPNRHLAFGSGPHRCLGLHLARLELKIALEEILRRMPDYRVRTDEVVRAPGVTRMIKALPVDFTPGKREHTVV